MKTAMTLKEMQAQYLAAKEAYYNEEPIMTDKAFDKLENDIRALAPKWKELAKSYVKNQEKLIKSFTSGVPYGDRLIIGLKDEQSVLLDQFTKLCAEKAGTAAREN